MPPVAARTQLQTVDSARLAVDVAADKQASDVVMLDITGVSDFADYFVVLTAESSRQMGALSEEIESALAGEGVALHHSEGTAQGGWVLLDFGDLIVHLFRPEQREFYQIEEAWSEGTETVRIQ